MSGAGIAIIVLLALILCVVGWFISVSNNINRVKLKIEESLSGVEIQLRQRYDVLMQGKTADESLDERGRFETNIKYMRSFLTHISNCGEAETSVIPVGDGMSISVVR